MRIGRGGETTRVIVPRLCGIAPLALVAATCLAACGDDGGDGDSATAGASTTSTTSSTQASPSTVPPDESTTTATASGDEPTAANVEPPTGAVSPIVAAEAVLTSDGTPAQACDRYVTEAFIETAYGGKANCLASRKRDALARSIDVGSLDADDQPIRLVVRPKGGPYDGASVDVELVRDGELFRVDALEADIPAGP